MQDCRTPSISEAILKVEDCFQIKEQLKIQNQYVLFEGFHEATMGSGPGSVENSISTIQRLQQVMRLFCWKSLILQYLDLHHVDLV